MMHLPNLIEDLGLILMAAAVVTLIFKKLKQPVVLGYLIAGFLVGPHFHFLPSVKDTANVTIWAEIGVIFMLFGLGLEFSFKKLAKVGKSASITATFEILFMLGVGYMVGRFLKWSTMDSLFLGGILSISSTTIIVRAFDELKLKGRNFVSLVFGVLIVEDLIAILLLVLLSSVAVTQTLSGSELTYSSLRLGFFLVVWFLLGIYLLPILLRKFKDLLTDETMLIVSIGLCLMMVIVASYAGFSPALGAFVMGSLLAETPKGHRIEGLIHPVKDLFSAIFFVSVGMLINPQILSEYLWVIILITIITIAGKLISTTLGALVSGRNIRHSVQAGMSLAQIGEFSFIIATLGMTLKVTSDFLYPIAVSVSAITTFTTPYLIKHADFIAEWTERKLPQNLRQLLMKYEITMSTSSDENILNLIWREYGIKVILNSVLVIAITLSVTRLLMPKLDVELLNGPTILILCGLTLLASAPFLWAIFLGKPKHLVSYKPKTIERLQRLQVGVSIVRFLVGCILVGFVVSNFTSIAAFTGLFFIAIAALGISFFSRFSEPIYKNIESRFLANLASNELLQVDKKELQPELSPWNATLVEYVVSQNSPLVAKSILESGIKEKYGAIVAMIERGDTRIVAPQGVDLLLPGDKLYVIGTEDQLLPIREIIERKSTTTEAPHTESFGLDSIVLAPGDLFSNKTIRESGVRDVINGLIVGIERHGNRMLNPDPSMVLQSGDLIWVVGDRKLIKSARTQKQDRSTSV